MAIDDETRQPINGNNHGGHSGPAIRPIALHTVYQVYLVCRARGIPIIGQGGIATAHDALEFVLAGATTVGLGTALFYDPLAPVKVNAGIEEYLRVHRFTSITDLIGGIDPAKALNQAASG
jgi:dihydroorotate dehydrogenase (NAD+) catalytic subunit